MRKSTWALIIIFLIAAGCSKTTTKQVNSIPACAGADPLGAASGYDPVTGYTAINAAGADPLGAASGYDPVTGYTAINAAAAAEKTIAREQREK
jgi:hypothetical protein